MQSTYEELKSWRDAEFYYLWGRCPDMDPPENEGEDYEDE